MHIGLDVAWTNKTCSSYYISCCTLPVEINKMTACLTYGAGDPAGNEVSKGAVREQNIGHTN